MSVARLNTSYTIVIITKSSTLFIACSDIANIDGAYLENGGWGKVRHPNYVGEILCTLALCLPLYWRFVPQPLLLALFHCACLVHRSGRIQRRMVNNDVGPYAAYRARVPRRLVPGIF